MAELKDAIDAFDRLVATAAETGFPGTLLDAVSASNGVDEAVVLATDASPPILLPGESNSTTIRASRSAQFLSIAAMLGQTNDGFYALRSVRLPLFIGESKYYYAAGYDAGSEDNNEIGIDTDRQRLKLTPWSRGATKTVSSTAC